jgi:MFS family permease
MTVISAFRATVSYLALPLLIKFFRKGTELSPSVDGSDHQHTVPHGAETLDRTLLSAAILADIAGFLSYALAPNGVLYTIGGALAAFGAIGLSTTEATLTKHIDPSHIGELMGGIGFLQGIVRILAPGTVNLVYAATAEGKPHIAFLGVAGMLGFALLLTLFLHVREP